jgi:hypothetical protein
LDSNGHEVFGAEWVGLDPPRHLVLFTAPSLISTVSQAGFVEIRQVRSSFVTQWYFTSSYRIGRSEDPFSTNGACLPQWLKLKAAIADWQAFLHPKSAEEIIIMARRPL